MINTIGHLVLNVALSTGVIVCLHHVDPYLAYAAGAYWLRELHALVVAHKLRTMMEPPKITL